ncbi:MAG: transposase [Coleofasciculaceae cyanobacterium]
MHQVLTAKLKLLATPEQKEALRAVSLAYREGLNFASHISFENNKLSSGVKLQKLVYNDLRVRFGLGSQMACNIPRQVAATCKGLWTKVKQNSTHIKEGKTKKRYKGLDNPPKFVSRTCTLNYGRDYSFAKNQQVSVITLNKRTKIKYEGYSKHLEYLQSDNVKIGAAKIYYSKPTKTYYLLVSFEISLEEITSADIQQIVGVDVGQRYLAVTTTTNNQTQFFSGKQVLHKATRYQKARRCLQKKGTRSATRRLVALSGRERRLTSDVNHTLAKRIVKPNTLIGLENLAHIRERTKTKKGKKASKKQRNANRNRAKWAFAELHGYVDYKAVLNRSLATKIDAHYTSQMCTCCGYTSRQNRPEKGLLFVCQQCGFTLHADLLGARNIALRTLISRQEWEVTGRFSAVLDASSEEAKTERLLRYSGLRWTTDAIP